MNRITSFPDFPELPDRLLIRVNGDMHEVYEPRTGKIIAESAIPGFAETYCKGFLDTLASAKNSVPTQGDENEVIQHLFAYLIGIRDAYLALQGLKKGSVFSDKKIG